MLICTALLVACEPFGPGGDSPGPPDGGQGRLHLSTDSLDFGSLSVAEEGDRSLSFSVRNTGNGLLKVAGLNKPIGDASVFSTDAPPLLELKPDETQEIWVQFSPTGSGDYGATLLPNGQATLQLIGTGLAPALHTAPEDLSFENEPVGCSSQKILEIFNDGEEALDLHSAEISGSPAFRIDLEAPLWLEPGTSTDAIVVFAPSTGSMHSSVLQLQSNDPERPTHVLPLSALGYEGASVNEQFEYEPYGRTDLLLVLNERATVISRIDANNDGIEDYLESLEGLDWRLAVSNMESTCQVTSKAWLDSNDPLSEAASALTSALSLSGTGGQKLFEKASSLLQRTDEGDCLDGFLRENSLLQIAFISDQPDSSAGSVSSNIQDMMDQLASNQSLSISSFSGTGSGGCVNTPRLSSATSASQGAHVDLCAEDLSVFLDELSEQALEERDSTVSYGLAEPPVVSTLSVRANERDLTAWNYLSTSNQLVVDGLVEELQEGDEILVSYLAAVSCE